MATVDSVTPLDPVTAGNDSVILWTSPVAINAAASIFAFLLTYIFTVRYLLEPILLPRWWGAAFKDLSAYEKRSFITHHMWLVVKVCVICCVYPLIRCLFSSASLYDSIVANGSVTYLDWLLVGWFAILSMFLFELIFRLNVSPVSTIHHTAGICLAAWQLTEQVRSEVPLAEVPAFLASTNSQFLLIMIYGAFEVIFESGPHLGVIYHRYYKHHGRWASDARMWRFCSIWSAIGSFGELACVIVYMVLNFWKWDLGMKIAMPILHVAFQAAQIHGFRVTWKMSKQFYKKAREEAESLPEVSTVPVLENLSRSRSLIEAEKAEKVA